MKLARKIGITLLLILLPLVGQPTLAQGTVATRLQIGINLLPAVIAANQYLTAGDNTGDLPIYLLYQDNRHLADQLKPGLTQIDAIRKRPLEITSTSLDELLASKPSPMSAIFIAEPVGERLDDLVRFANENRVLLFSPFKGDVERGVTAGFRVTDKVLPLVNMTSLKESKIQLKAFFLRIAVKHE